MIRIVPTLTFLLLVCSNSHAEDYFGTYTTVPETFPGFHEPSSKKAKMLIQKMTWRMVINEKHISIKMNDDFEKILLDYKADGEYLLGIESESDIVKYTPFYVKNSHEIHGMGTIFFREE